MNRRALLKGLSAGTIASALEGTRGMAHASGETGDGPVFELRIYHTYEGKLDDLLARFRDHTITIFKRHGMESIAYWTPTDDPLKGKTLVYILKHPSRTAALASWAAFHEVNGKLVEKVDSTYMKLTDFSPHL
jgi:hypothetical protein